MGSFAFLIRFYLQWFLVITNPDKYAPIMAPHLYVMMWQIMVEKLSSK